MQHVNARHHLEKLAGYMGRSPIAYRCHVDLAGIRLGISDELRNSLGWNRWMNDHDVWQKDETRDRRDVLNEIEVEFLIESRIDRIRWRGEEKRIAIGRR